VNANANRYDGVAASSFSRKLWAMFVTVWSGNLRQITTNHFYLMCIHRFHSRLPSWFLSAAQAHSAGAWWVKCTACNAFCPPVISWMRMCGPKKQRWRRENDEFCRCSWPMSKIYKQLMNFCRYMFLGGPLWVKSYRWQLSAARTMVSLSLVEGLYLSLQVYNLYKRGLLYRPITRSGDLFIQSPF
jgi:hypothetical protein